MRVRVGKLGLELVHWPSGWQFFVFWDNVQWL